MLPWNSITIQVEGILRVYWVPRNGPERMLYAVRIKETGSLKKAQRVSLGFVAQSRLR